MDPQLKLGEEGSARPVLEEFLSYHDIGKFGADKIEELLDLKPRCMHPDSGQAAILATKSTDETINAPYLVVKVPKYYECGLETNRVCVISILGEFRPGNKVYLAALQRTRDKNKPYAEPVLNLHVYDISPEQSYQEVEDGGNKNSCMKSERFEPKGISPEVRCEQVVKEYEQEISRLMDEVSPRIAADFRAVVASVGEHVLKPEGDHFYLTADGYSHIRFNFDPAQPGPSPAERKEVIDYVIGNGFMPKKKYDAVRVFSAHWKVSKAQRAA